MWRDRIRDHLCAGHQPWGRLLEQHVEKSRLPLTFEILHRTTHLEFAQLDLPHLSRDLWTFLGPRLGESIYSRRIQLAGGEDRNGIELWRRLYMEHEGGAEQVALAGLRRFHAFPKCPSLRDLNAHIGEWLKARAEFAHGVPPEHLREFFLDILPDTLRLEIIRRKVDSLDAMIAFAQEEVARENDKRLAVAHEARRKEILGTKTESFVGAAVHGALGHAAVHGSVAEPFGPPNSAAPSSGP